MTTITELKDAAQRILIAAAEKASRTTGFTKRNSKLTGALFVQTLVLGWLSRPEATLEELSQTAATLGVRISPQGLDQRFTKEAAAFLHAVLKEAVHEKVRGEPVAVALLTRFHAVYLVDSSQVTLPRVLADAWRGNGRSDPKAGTEASVKIHLGIDLVEGTLVGPELTDGKEQDRNANLMATVLPKDTLRIADLGYFRLSELARQSRLGVDWLTRFQTTTGFYDADGRAWELDAFLLAHDTDRSEADGPWTLDVPILLGLSERLPCRLLAVRVPSAVAEERRRKLRQKAKARGGTPSKKELALCDWSVLLTSVPVEKLSLSEVFVLARLRWQIELVFKLWKSYLRIDEWRSKNPWRILCEVYAKLLAALLQHWTLVVTGWEIPDRSLFKAAATVRSFARSIALALCGKASWDAVIGSIRRCLQAGCRLNKRRKAPSSAQLSFDPLLLGLN